MFPRFLESRVREILTDTPVLGLIGPSQSGKTTLAKQVSEPDRRYLTLDDSNVLAAARADPVALIRDADRVVIDEIQRAPDLMLAIKQSVDSDRRPGRFLLTGSANILTAPRMQESMTGRTRWRARSRHPGTRRCDARCEARRRCPYGWLPGGHRADE